MNRVTRILVAVLGVLLLLVAVLALALTAAIRRPYPRTAGTLQLAGLQAPVTVRRDAAGIPHIYAENEHDLFFAQGYTHAQDRFWQMEFWRHTSSGRLSEIVGEATLETDKFIRNMGWNRMAAETTDWYRTQDPALWAIMEAYAAGVNAYIAEHAGAVSINQTVLGLTGAQWEITPWTPQDSIAWGIVMAWDLRGAGDMNEEILRAELTDALGADLAARFYPAYPTDRPVIVPPPYGGQADAPIAPQAVDVDWATLRANQIGAIPPAGFALGSGAQLGSNNWVVSGEHTASGRPLLANDPHLGVQMPAIWYLNGLHAPTYDAVGFSFAGIPGLVVGHNANIAWGVTNMGADSQDLYIEKINPDNPRQYEYMGEWRDMTVIVETINVNGGEPVMLEVLETVHGPLLNTVDDDLTQALAVRWTMMEPSRIFKAVDLLARAQNYDDFRNALQYWDTSPQNVVYVDTAGNIAYQSTGRYPVRNGWNGAQPVPGWTGEYEWAGWIPYDEMPRLYNPARGFIVTANHAIVAPEFPYFLSSGWADGDRGLRIEQLIQAAIDSGQPLTVETLATIQVDSYEMLRDDLLPLLNRLTVDDPAAATALATVQAWDGQLRTDSVGATIFERWLLELAHLALADELGEYDEDVLRMSSEMRILLRQLAAAGNDPLWDDQTTADSETADAIAARALAAAVAWLSDNLGADQAAWTWGRVHTVTFRSNPLGESGIGAIEGLVNRGPYPTDGGVAVNASNVSWGDFARVTSNPSMRFVVDMGDLDRAQIVLPSGQSGHPYHRHYADMIDLWLQGEYHTLAYSAAAVEAGTRQTLTLEP